MIIRNNTIFFKSDIEYYQKEESDVKNNTVRFVTDAKEEQGIHNFYAEFLNGVQKSICISNVQFPLRNFTRTICDITRFYALGTQYFIITWSPVHERWQQK